MDNRKYLCVCNSVFIGLAAYKAHCNFSGHKYNGPIEEDKTKYPQFCEECQRSFQTDEEHTAYVKKLRVGIDSKEAINQKNNFSSPKSILEEAQEIIYGDREKTYGDPAVNLRSIASLWMTYLDNKWMQNRSQPIYQITATDVANMMILLKLARLINDPKHRDSLVDIAGYAALIDRINNSTKKRKQSNEQ